MAAPLVFLPGMLGDRRVWHGVASRIAPGTRVAHTSIAGFEDMSAAAAGVLAGCDRPVVLVGHSLGGIVALEAAVRHPERVAGLVLAASSARAPTASQRHAWRSLRERIDAGAFAQVADELAAAALGVRAGASPALRSQNRAMAEVIGPDGLAAQLVLQQSRRELRPFLPSLVVPVLVLSGADDLICPPELQREIGAAAPGAELVDLEDAGHMVPLQRPVDTAATIARWLAGRRLGSDD